MRSLIMGMVAIAALAVVLVPGLAGLAQPAPPQTFLETFDSDSGSPGHYVPPGWDVSIVSHADDTIENMWANHGPNCEPPDDTWPGGLPNSTHNHFITQASQATFDCSNHIMTAMNAGYGAVYLTPPALMDFRNGTATLEWDMSTERTSSRDWVDIMILPFNPADPSLEPPMALNMVDFHTPKDGIQVELQGGGNVFAAHTFIPAFSSQCGPLSYAKSASIYYCGMNFDGFHQWDMIQQLYGLHTSAARRDHFIIELSKTHLRMGFRPANSSGLPVHPYFYWIDTDIPAGPLRFDEGLVQLNQRAYNPLKGCGAIGTGEAGHPPDGWVDSNGMTCRAGTWHWDNVAISPADPITILPGARHVNSGGSVTFGLPAPANSFLKAAGSRGTEYSLDGTTWQRLPVVGPEGPVEAGDSFWATVPVGTQTVRFRNGTVQDVYLYTRTPRSTIPIPTPLPATATAIATRTPVSTPTATPTAFVPPTATSTLRPATATAVAAATSTAVVAATITPTPTNTATPAPPIDKPPTPTVVAPTSGPVECYARVVVRQDGTDTDSLAPQPTEFCGAPLIPAPTVDPTVTAQLKRPTNTPTPTPVSSTATPTPVSGCGSLQTLINNASSGSTLLLPACVFREAVIVNKPLTLDGQGAAQIRGSDVWTGWNHSGSFWQSTLTVPPLPTVQDPCLANTNNRCWYAEQVFVDGQPLQYDVVNSTPATGQFSLDGSRHVILASDPSGHVLEVTTRQRWADIQSDNVIFQRMTMRHAGSAPDVVSSIDNWFHNGFILRDSILSDVHGSAVSIDGGSNNQILRNDISRAGYVGIGGGAPSIGNLIQGNTIHDTGIDGFDPNWAAGGLKIVAQSNLTIDSNTVYNVTNGGAGIWCDIGCDGVTISNNRVHHVNGSPIFFEISSNATISNNVIYDSGPWGSPNVATSGHVNVFGNFVARSYSIHAALEGGTQLDTVCNCHVRIDAPADAGSYLTFHDNQCVSPVDGGCISFQNLTADGQFSASLYNNSDTNNVTLTGQAAIDALNAHGVPQ